MSRRRLSLAVAPSIPKAGAFRRATSKGWCSTVCALFASGAEVSDAVAPLGTAYAAKAKDLEALRDAVVDAASVGAGLWLSYLFVLLYLAIAVGSVTHRDLLLESPVKLPFLNVDLPLVGFFVLGPLLFVIVHAYVLLHFALLGGKVGAFDVELRVQITEDDVRSRLRRQLPSNIFVQFLAGPRDVRTGVIGILLQLIAWISLVLGLLALLVFFQLQFLPYHHEAITWWQRVAIVVDLVLLWIMWPSVARGETTWLSRYDFRRGAVATVVLASLAVSLALVLLVFEVATFPGESLDENPLPVGFLPSLRKLLVAGDIDYVARKPKTLWSNVLVLPNIDVIDHAKFDTEEKIAALPETLSLRGRRLEGAVLLNAHLRKVDFTAARLQGSNLSGADLRDANWGCEPQCADLRGARLRFAQLQGASLGATPLTGANLMEAQLQGTNLRNAQLQGANLCWAALEGAFMWDAQLQGANLWGARLNGADMSGAKLQGANFQRAALIGADLTDSFLWQTNFGNANLTLADLCGADFTKPNQERINVICDDEQRQLPKDLEFNGVNILGDDNPIFTNVGQGARLTTDEAAYDKVLAPFLVDAANDPFVLAGIAQRDGFGGQNPPGHKKMMSRSLPEKERTLYRELSCGLLRKIKEGNVQLERRVLYLVTIISPNCQQWCSDFAAKC
jgi:uncharacterized protein YjbI with pentapeptide repeats